MMTYQKQRIDIISMGCSKNLIDSERLMRQLGAKGYEVVHDSEEPCGEYVVVNTCGFIADAKEESINLLLQLAERKKDGAIGHLIAMGCLTERYRRDIETEMPEIDTVYGKFDWKSLIESLPDKAKDKEVVTPWQRTITTAPHYTYLKISEGCNRFCAFCAIPLITGRHKSRPIEEIAEEVKWMVSQGVREFNIIAQDLSSYGLDLYGEHRLAVLLETLAQIEGVEWLRLHYAYPTDFPKDILPVMARYDNICKYLDIALQHSSDRVLENMRRHITCEETRQLINEIRKTVPGIKLRTTMMVGFTGEEEEDFAGLLEFVKEMKFDRLGAFAYSEEDDTWAAMNLEDSIPEDEKQRRLDLLMHTQEEIARQLNDESIGKRMKVVVDEIEGETRVCRSEFDSPDVDPVIYVEGSDAMPGQFINIVITDADTYDLYGKVSE